MKFDMEAQRGRFVARAPMRTLVLLATGLAMSAAWSAQVAGGGIGKVVNQPPSTYRTPTAPVGAASAPAKPAQAGRTKAASAPQSK